MTELTRPVRRVTAGMIREQGKYRQVVVSLEPPNVLTFRAKGTRRTYLLTAEACYMMAVRAAVASTKLEKAKARKERVR